MTTWLMVELHEAIRTLAARTPLGRSRQEHLEDACAKNNSPDSNHAISETLTQLKFRRGCCGSGSRLPSAATGSGRKISKANNARPQQITRVGR